MAKNDTKETAIAKVEPKTVAKAEDTKSAEGFVSVLSENDIKAAVADGGFSVEKFYSMADIGTTIKGVLLGRGAPCDVAKPGTGETQTLQTWRIRISDSITVRILSTAQLENALPPLVGYMVMVAKVGEIPISGGRRVSDFLVGVGPRVIADPQAPLPGI